MIIYNDLLEEIKTHKTNLFQKDFLLTWEKTKEELEHILDTAQAIKYLYENNISVRCFDSGLAISQFRDKSTRTRFSFSSAANLLGLEVQDLEESRSQIAHGETIRETANMISFLTEIIGIRDDIYPGQGDSYMRKVGAALDDGFKEGVLYQRPGIINLQSDIDHPTQSMADLLYLKNHFGSLENLKGKKIAVTWAYSPSYGKPLSVPQGIIGLMTRFGMEVELAHPEGYDLMEEVIEIGSKNAAENGGSLKITNNMDRAFENADIVYPKSWASYQIMKERTKLLKSNDQQGLNELERKCLAENANHKDWECNEEKMKLTKNREALYMHCLPADISNISCKNGEVQDTVFNKYRTHLYKQASYKPFIIAAVIITNRFKDTGKLFEVLMNKRITRIKI